MFSTDAYLIRAALPHDEPLLLRLSVLDSQRPIARPALIGERDGVPAAAIELETGRVIADPFASTAALTAHLRLRAMMLKPASRRPRLVDKLRGASRQARWA